MWNFLKRFKKIEDPELREAMCGLRRIETTKPEVVPFVSSKKPAATIPLPPGTFAQIPQGRRSAQLPPGTFNQPPDAILSISSPDGVDSIVIEANSRTIMEAWDTKAAMVDRPVGSFGFADGLAYIMTRGGWVNLGETLEKPLEMTNRRGAIRAQKARKAADSDFLENVVRNIVASPDHKILMEATISDHGLDMAVDDAIEAMKLMSGKGKLCFLLFVLGSAEEVLGEIEAVPFLQEVT